MLNVALLKNPVNWFVILFMLILAGIAGHFLLSLAGLEPATAQS